MRPSRLSAAGMWWRCGGCWRSIRSWSRRGSGRRGRRAAPDLPIVDAGPGFVAEPVSVSISTVYYFPAGEKQLQEQSVRMRGGIVEEDARQCADHVGRLER